MNLQLPNSADKIQSEAGRTLFQQAGRGGETG